MDDVPRALPVCVFAPATLLTITAERTTDDGMELHVHPGGQGFWVARMLRVLGATPVLCTAVGGETGAVLRGLLEQEGLGEAIVETALPSGAYVHDRTSGERRELLSVDPPTLRIRNLDELVTATLGAALRAGTCVLAGPQDAPVLELDVYRRLAHDLHANGVRVVADLSGDALRAALEGGIDVLKASHIELQRGGWLAGESRHGVEKAMLRLRDEGARDVVVSREVAPVLALVDDACFEVDVPAMETVDARGAGDSMTAALALGVAANGALDERTLALATAAGSLNVTRHGLATGHATAIEQLAARLTVRRL